MDSSGGSAIRVSAVNVPRTTFALRMSVASAKTLSDRRLLWALVAVFALRRFLAEIPVFMPDGADVYAFLYDGRRALINPGAIYPDAAAQIAHGFVFVTLYPPPQLLVAAIYALIPGSAAAVLWVATNTLASLIALILLLRMVGRVHPAAQPIFWLLVLCFTPLFEDIRLGQRGGVMMLLSVGAMGLVVTRPAAAGALAGLATSFKFYPGAMVLGVDPRRQWTFIVTLIATSAAVLGASFIPFGSPLFYLTRVLVPGLTWQNSGSHDCFQNSTQLLYARVVGGESYGVIDQAGVWRQVTLVPWHSQSWATALAYSTILLVIAATVWGVWRSGVAQPYSLALCFSLGTIVPGEAFTYQFLPMLPLLVIVFMKALQQKKVVSMVTLAAALWILLVSPCSLPLPSLWTVAALAIFAVAVWHATLFRNPPGRDEAGPPVRSTNDPA
jgi:Glycosyltransferase family 87